MQGRAEPILLCRGFGPWPDHHRRPSRQVAPKASHNTGAEGIPRKPVRGPGRRKETEGAVVEMVSMAVTAVEPGVTLEGVKEQVASEGRVALAQPSATALVKAPSLGLTEIVKLAAWPGLTLAVEGEALTAKLVAVTWMATVGVRVTPLLVALRLTVFDPAGQFGDGVEAVPAPQVPDQL